ncbi:glyoxalase family protein [Rhodococcus rhodochrous]|uniref:VOC family protein n=1 Tax=Rhodococcus rhodochrous TaxID=1829 RepID=UPI000751557A|nr:VOC family protein [Rhodococcus rhodochrous]MDO1485128.1 VOC family protein [Rhodococcus rhodochrous]SNV09911.1 glyoxalase family protein [Rhodococcus rhodochrous]
MAPFPALTHVAVTVSNLPASIEWYTRLFGAPPVLDEDEESGTFHHAVFALGGGTMFGLHTHTGATPDTGFDERRVGLDHLAFACTAQELPRWRDRLDDLGITHGGIKTASYGSGLSFRDPDDIALEFFAPPG